MATCAEKLAEARDALHGLLVGKAVVSIAFEGERTEFARSDLPRLRAYVRELEAECGEDLASARRAPARVLY
jgi:hypothetical protein